MAFQTKPIDPIEEAIVDKVMMRYSTFLNQHRGKYVAIDITNESVAGMGDTPQEAFQKANQNSHARHFNYRQIGSNKSVPSHLLELL